MRKEKKTEEKEATDPFMITANVSLVLQTLRERQYSATCFGD